MTYLRRRTVAAKLVRKPPSDAFFAPHPSSPPPVRPDASVRVVRSFNVSFWPARVCFRRGNAYLRSGIDALRVKLDDVFCGLSSTNPCRPRSGSPPPNLGFFRAI